MKRIIYFFLVIMLMFVFAACSEDEASEEEEEEERIVSVEVANVEEGDLTVEKSIFGRTAPNSTAPILIQTPGEVDSLEFENGDEVDKDDLIATLDTVAGKQNVRAPKDGILTGLSVQEGDFAQAEEPFAIISDMETMKVQLTVTDQDFSLISVDETYDSIIDGEKYEATITSMDQMPDETGLYPVTATINNEDQAILPGMVVELMIPEKKIDSALIVPTAAVIQDNDEAFVYMVGGDIVQKKKVTVKEMQSEKTAIEGEVKEGDQVVISGQLTLSDGHQVNVVKGD